MSIQAPSVPTTLYAAPAPHSRGLGLRLGRRLRRGSDLLALAFATSVGMWALGYVGHAPFASWPSAPFVALMLVCVVVGGFVAGRNTPRGIWGGAWVGAMSAVLNLLILGSIIKEPQTGQIVPTHLLWIPASILFQAALGAIGASVGIVVPGRRNVHWKPLLLFTFVVLTLLLITAGGLVTGFKAGLAVPDWPNSYGSNMLLYPLKSMIERKGVFYEHAHRLLGMFVGLCGITGAVYLTMVDRRKWVLIAAWSVFAAVCGQGLMGGLRVTGKLTTATTNLAPSENLALIHGIFAHLVLAGFVIVAVLSVRLARSGPRRAAVPAAADMQLAWLLAAAVLGQSFIGGFVRHFNELVLLHVTIAAGVAVFALAVGVRAWAVNRTQPILRRLGLGILLILVFQVTLGIIALVVRTPGNPNPAPLTAIITTLHQANAALLLATTVALATFSTRLRAIAS